MKQCVERWEDWICVYIIFYTILLKIKYERIGINNFSSGMCDLITSVRTMI